MCDASLAHNIIIDGIVGSVVAQTDVLVMGSHHEYSITDVMSDV